MQVANLKTGLFDPTIATHKGRLVKTTGDGFLVEASSSAAPSQSQPPPDRDERGITNERPQDCGVGRRNHAADPRGDTPADETGHERQGGMAWRHPHHSSDPP
jgi:hypothetical protein